MKNAPESYFKNLLIEAEFEEHFRQELEKLNEQYKSHDIIRRYEIRESKQEGARINDNKRKEHFLLIEIEQAQIEIPMEIHNEYANTYTTTEYRAYLEKAYNTHELGASLRIFQERAARGGAISRQSGARSEKYEDFRRLFNSQVSPRDLNQDERRIYASLNPPSSRAIKAQIHAQALQSTHKLSADKTLRELLNLQSPNQALESKESNQTRSNSSQSKPQPDNTNQESITTKKSHKPSSLNIPTKTKKR